MTSEKSKGLIAILSANTIFGLNIPVTKALIAGWMSPMAYTFTRMLFGTLVFWTLSIWLKNEKVARKDLFLILLGGLVGYLGTQFLFSQSLQFTSPVVFSLIMSLTPVIVLLASALFLKEAVSGLKMLGIFLSVGGAAFIIVIGSNHGFTGSNNALGITYALLCALAFSGYLMLTRKVSLKYTPVTVAKWMFLISAMVALPLSVPVLDSQKIYSAEVNITAILLLVFSLLFSTTIAFFLMPYALKRLEASTVSIFMNVQPIVASVLAIIIGQDVLTWEKPFAIIMVITGVYLVTKPQSDGSKLSLSLRKNKISWRKRA